MENKNIIDVEKIQKFMQEYELSQCLFCDYCGLSIATFRRILNNDPNIRLSSLRKVAKLMQIKVSQLFNKE